MRLRAVTPLLMSVLLAAAAPAERGRTAAPARPSGPPHAYLFGTWTGGLFPVLDGMVEQDCQREPTVVFSRDVLAHANLTSPILTRRIIETVRGVPGGTEFRLTPDPSDPEGFGCETPDVLHVMLDHDGEIGFPNCAAFPYKLRKCPGPA